MKMVSLEERAGKNSLHVETPLGIVNIRAGLEDAAGRRVVSVELIPDWTPAEGRFVEIYGMKINRLIELKAEEKENAGMVNPASPHWVDMVIDGTWRRVYFPSAASAYTAWVSISIGTLARLYQDGKMTAEDTAAEDRGARTYANNFVEYLENGKWVRDYYATSEEAYRRWLQYPAGVLARLYQNGELRAEGRGTE